MDPATAATAVTIAGALKDYGPWGVVAFLLMAVIYLHRGWQACQEARITDGRLATEALTRQASTNAEIASMMASLREGQTEVMRIASLIQRDAENDDERIQEKIGGLAKTIETLGGRIDAMSGRLDAACRGGVR